MVLEVLKVDLHDHKPLIALLRGLDGEADIQKYDAIVRKARSIWFHRVDEWAASTADTARDPPTKLTLPVRELFWTFGFWDHNILDISALNLPHLREICIRGVWSEENTIICDKSSQAWGRLWGSLKPIVDSYKELETLRIRWDDLSLTGSLQLFKMFPSFRNLKHLDLVLECAETSFAVVTVAQLVFLETLSIRCVHRHSEFTRRRLVKSRETMRAAAMGFRFLQSLSLEETEGFLCGFIRAMPSCPLTGLNIRILVRGRQLKDRPPSGLADLIVERFGSLRKLRVKSSPSWIFSEQFFASLCTLELVTAHFSNLFAEKLTPELYEMMARGWPQLEELEICLHPWSRRITENVQGETSCAENDPIRYFKNNCPRLRRLHIQ